MKARYDYVVEGYYSRGTGWDLLFCAESRREARAAMLDYMREDREVKRFRMRRVKAT